MNADDSIRLRRLIAFNPSKSEARGVSRDASVTFLPMEAVSELGDLDLSNTKPLLDVYNGYTYFRSGDVVVAKITPCFENGKGALIPDLATGIGFGTTEFHVLRPSHRIVGRYLSYVTRSVPFRSLGAAEMKGAAGQQRVPEDFIRDFRIPLPAITTQQAIADYLDEKTADLDALIAKKRKLLDLLAEERAALINQAVTKGLDSNMPMKNSGIPWIGGIPAHWKIKRLKLTCRLETGHTPSRTEPSYWVEEECVIPWVSLNDTKTLVEHDTITETRYQVSPRGMANSSAHLIDAGAVVFTRDASIGLAATTTRPMAVSQHIIAWVCGPQLLNWYLLRVIAAMQQELDSLTFGATLKTIGMGAVREMATPLPPIREQVRIVAFLVTELDRMTALRKNIEKQLDRLQEYRQALITAAVTGQLDIGAAA